MGQDKWIGGCLVCRNKTVEHQGSCGVKNVPLCCPKGRQETPSILLQLNISMRKEAKGKDRGTDNTLNMKAVIGS